MDSCTLLPLQCFQNHEDVTIMREFFNHLSTCTYDGEGEVAWLEYLYDFISMIHEEDGCSDEQANLLLAYTLRESPLQWLFNLLLIECTHLSTFVISLKTLYIILNHTILTKKCYKNGRICINRYGLLAVLS